MSDAFVAEIRMFPFSFAPTGWAFCNGQLLPISQNTALFSLIGTFYGGDGKSNFALPNMQGSHPMHAGSSSGGLSTRSLGEQGGVESITLLTSEIPIHTHAITVSGFPGDQPIPGGNLLGAFVGDTPYRSSGTSTNLAIQQLAVAGGSLPHNNLQPYLVVNFCIALQGVFPQRP